MLKKSLFFFLLIFICISFAGSVFATGKECTTAGGCPTGEQCCCCYMDKSCNTPQEMPDGTDETPVKGRCFPAKIYTGTQGVSVDVNCPDVVCPFSQHTDIKDFIDSAVNYIFYISVILVPLMVVIGGFLLLVSTGNPKQAKLGREIIQWSVIGFAVTLFAKSISSIIKMILVG